MRLDVSPVRAAALLAMFSSDLVSAAPRGPGPTSSALPGIVRVPHPTATGEGPSVAATAGYGFTEEVGEDDGVHHRVLGSLAAAYSPMPELGAGLRFDGRLDLHPGAANGSDSGAVGDPRVFVRAGTELDSLLSLGAEVALWLPGRDAPSVAFDAASVDARLLAGFRIADRFVLDVAAGYRLDNSAQAIDDPNRISFSDRVSLGLSDFDAVLLGVGASFGVGAAEVLAELTAEPLVGSGAPGIADSALRANAGVRLPVTTSLWAGALAEVLLSGRPEFGPGSGLTPVEPRASVLATLAYAFGGAASEAVAPAPPPKPAPVEETPAPAPPVEPTERDVMIRVHDRAGNPIVDAEVRVIIGEREFPASVVEGDVYRAESVTNGSGSLVISAPGFRRVEQDLTPRGDDMEIDVELEPAAQTAQLRGLVRGFNGAPIAATIRVEPGKRVLTASDEGTFAVDLDPGNYEVTISADGFRDQRRRVRVERGGVVILNAELLKE